MIESMSERFYQIFSSFGPKIPGLILTVLIGYLSIQLALYLLRRGTRLFRFNKSLTEFIVSLASIFFWILFLAEAARQVGLSSLALTISGSIVALGFALANGAAALTSDVIAGLFFAKDRDFEVGFYIKSGDIEGVVEKIDIRKIRIRDGKGNLVILPNSKVDTLGWTVLKRD
ncbi:MAG TPA: mechanosensitive ion channel [bacterium]|nr:mechanosensitive ion channel [bacterium]